MKLGHPEDPDQTTILEYSSGSDLVRSIISESAQLRMGDGITSIEGETLPSVLLPLDPKSIARVWLPGDLPNPVEMERAIDLIEGAIMAARIAHANRGVLVTSSAVLRKIPGLDSNNATLTRDEIEEKFNRLAMAAHGQRSALGDLPQDPEVAAALIILRESMHHLGFDEIRAADLLIKSNRKAS